MKDAITKLARRGAWKVRDVVSSPLNLERIHARSVEHIPEMPEFVAVVNEPAFIEPEFGYVVTESGRLLEDSMAYGYGPWMPIWRYGLPSPSVIRSAVSDPTRVVHVPTMISLRHWWEWNFYHFQLDVLGKLQLFEKLGIPDDTPVVLGRYVDQVSWARNILALGKLSKRQWLVPDLENRTYFKADRIYYCRSRQTYRDKVEYIMREMQIDPPDESANERVYLTRRPPAHRLLLNEEDCLAVLGKYGFRMVDAAAIDFSEQVKLFSRTRFLVGLHGAGLTNVVYRRGMPMGVLELHGDTFVSPDMLNICKEFGYYHRRLSGPPLAGPGTHVDFSIDPAKLEHAIQEMLGEAA